MKKETKKYTAEFKQQVLELVDAGKPIPELAKEYEIPNSVIYTWRRKARLASEGQAPHLGSEARGAVGDEGVADEVRSLRRELARVKQENLILKKAAVILGTEAQPKITK